MELSLARLVHPTHFRLRAISLYIEGTPISQISKELSVSSETVRSWVRGRREQKGKQVQTPELASFEQKDLSERRLTSVIRGGVGEAMELTTGLLVKALQNRAANPTPISIAEANLLATIASRLVVALRACPAVTSAALEEFEMSL